MSEPGASLTDLKVQVVEELTPYASLLLEVDKEKRLRQEAEEALERFALSCLAIDETTSQEGMTIQARFRLSRTALLQERDLHTLYRLVANRIADELTRAIGRSYKVRIGEPRQ